jgi:hypothetical protein
VLLENNGYTVWIEAEQWSNGLDALEANSDVVVELEDGSRWVATFFTFKNIDSLVKKNRSTGECLHGKYFWASDMILVDEISRNRIIEVIDDLIQDGSFSRVFSPVPVE